MPDDSKRPLKVFLCHAHPDAEKVRALYARLKADGVDAWLDKENIIPGQDWEMEIRKAVRESDIVVVCLSKQFSQKGYRQNEVRIALDEANLQPEGEIFIIPARLEECNYLESLKRFHGVDLFEERGYEYLMRALRLRADKIGAVLQSKKGWLNGFTVPVKKTAPKKPEPVKSQPTPEPEEPKPVIIQKPPRKWNSQIIAAIAGVVVIFAAIFGLPWNQWFSAAPNVVTVTPTNTVTFTPPQPTSTFILVSPTETETPTHTPTATFSAPFNYIVQEGDYLALIAEKNNLGFDGIQLILFLNPYKGIDQNTGYPIGIDPQTQNILPGQTILIPNPGMELPTSTPIPPNLPRGTKVEYTLQAGDSLGSIAASFNSTIDDIIIENNIIDPNALRVGDVLVIPVNMVTPTATP